MLAEGQDGEHRIEAARSVSPREGRSQIEHQCHRQCPRTGRCRGLPAASTSAPCLAEYTVRKPSRKAEAVTSGQIRCLRVARFNYPQAAYPAAKPIPAAIPPPGSETPSRSSRPNWQGPPPNPRSRSQWPSLCWPTADRNPRQVAGLLQPGPGSRGLTFAVTAARAIRLGTGHAKTNPAVIQQSQSDT